MKQSLALHYKYLVHLTNDLSWTLHIQNIATNANKALSFLT